MASKLFGSKNPIKPHLVVGPGGLAAEIYDVRRDVESAFSAMESGGGLVRTDEFINPVAADTDGIKLSIATDTSVASYGTASLNGVVGAAEMVPARNVTVTASASVDVTGGVVTFTGRVRLADGTLAAATATVTVAAGGGATYASTGALSFVDSISVPAQGGVAGTLSFGFGVRIGLKGKIKTRAGLTAPLREVAVGAVVTTGAFALPTGCPVTVYTPAAAPDGVRDYAVTYEVDPS